MRVDDMPAGREMDKLIGKEVMKYWIYHYDKDVEENCYYCLMKEDSLDTVAPFTAKEGIHTGERKTEEEAWDDCPEFSEDISAAWEVVEKITDQIAGKPCFFDERK